MVRHVVLIDAFLTGRPRYSRSCAGYFCDFNCINWIWFCYWKKKNKTLQLILKFQRKPCTFRAILRSCKVHPWFKKFGYQDYRPTGWFQMLNDLIIVLCHRQNERNTGKLHTVSLYSYACYGFA